MANDIYSRALMGSSLGIHILFAITGMALPLLISVAELLGLTRGDKYFALMARRWSKALLVLFAVGSVTGTVVGFQLSLLWPPFMALAGKVIALPFAIEVFPFFIEAIFLGIYLATWDRFRRPLVHWLMSLPIVVSAAASGILITIVNAFMNTPAGFTLRNGQPQNVDPIQAVFNPSMPSEVLHVWVTAYLATAVALSGLAALSLLRRKPHPAYHLRALHLGMAMSAVGAVLAVVTGDSSAKAVAAFQPAKLAAMEAQFETQRRAAETIGGLVSASHAQVTGSIKIPGLLSWLAYGDVNAPVLGLDAFARSEWPPLMIHYTFDFMVGIGIWLGALTAGYWLLYVVRRQWTTRRPVLLAIVASLPLGYLAVELGWMTTEIGRQPWILYHIMTVAQAMTTSPYVPEMFFLFLSVYLGLAAATLVILLHYFRTHPLTAVIGTNEDAETAREDGDADQSHDGRGRRRIYAMPRRHTRRQTSRSDRKVSIHG